MYRFLGFTIVVSTLLLLGLTSCKQDTLVRTSFPDLMPLDGVAITPASVVVDQIVLVTFTMVNRGNGVASPALYTYTKQADGFSELRTVPNQCTGATVLQPGQSCVSSYIFKFPTPGTKEMEVVLIHNPTTKLPGHLFAFNILVTSP